MPPERRRELLAAVCLTVARLAMSMAVVCLCLASYAWWGSPRSPLGALWIAPVILLPVWFVFLLLHRDALKRLLESRGGPGVRLGMFDTLSTDGVRRLDSREGDDA